MKVPDINHCDEVGNPILPGTGNKIEVEADFQSVGEVALSLVRTYNHHWEGVGIFGKYWHSSFDYKLTFGTTSLDSCYPRPGGGACGIGANNVIYAWRPTGEVLKYTKNATDGVFYENRPCPTSRIVVNPADGGYYLYLDNNSRERYSSSGYIMEVRNAANVGWTFTYNGTYPTRITHTSGRYVDLGWNNGQLTSVRDPAGNFYGYAYTADAFGAGIHRLASAALPGSPQTTIAYHYEYGGYPGALTGKSINGVRYSRFTYNGDLAVKTEHNGQHAYTFNYSTNASGQWVVTTTNPLGKSSTSTYQDGRLLTVTGAASTNCPASYSEIVYDLRGYPTLKSDENGNYTSYSYNDKGQLLQRVDGFNTAQAVRTTYVWDATYNRVSTITLSSVTTGASFSRRSFTYEASTGRLTSVVDTNLSSHGIASQSLTTTYAYSMHPNGMLASMTVDGALPGTADAIVYVYNAFGDMTAVQNGLGHTVQFGSHNGLGQPGTVTYPSGATITYTYDARGRITLERRSASGIIADTNYTYDANGLVASVTLPNQVKWQYAYDAQLQMTGMFSDVSGVLNNGATREERRFLYDAMGNLTKTTDFATEGHYEVTRVFFCLQPYGAPRNSCVEPSYQQQSVWVVSPVSKTSVNYTYDELGRLLRVAGNNGQFTAYTYDNNNNVKTVSNALNQTTTYDYDSLDRPYRVVDPVGGQTQIAYNVAGDTVQVTDPRGIITAYIIDGLGQTWATSSPDIGTTSTTYTGSGLISALQRGNGITLNFAYDSAGRTTSVTGNGVSRTFSYDTCTNGAGRLCNATVTGQSEVKYQYDPWGRIVTQQDVLSGNTLSTGYSYNASGDLVGIGHPNGVGVGYAYTAGRLTNITATINGSTVPVASPGNYQTMGSSLRLAYGNGIIRQGALDNDGRMTSLSATDPATNVALQQLSYAFDAGGRIASISDALDANRTVTYGYNAAAMLTSAQSPQLTESFGLDALANRTAHGSSSLGNASLAYASGTNRIVTHALPAVARSFQYDGAGQTTAYTGIDGVANGVTYDAWGNLASHSRGGLGTTYLVNAMDQRVGRSVSGGSSRYVYQGFNQLLSEASNGVWTNYVWNGGDLVGVVRNNQVYAIHTDHLGRPQLATDSAKAVVWKANNSAFARNVVQDSFGGLNIGLPGQYYDQPSGLWHNGYREYDANMGRYLQPDPIGLGGGLNRYAYVGGNPVNAIDPLGLLAYIHCKGNNIGIYLPLSFHGNGASSANIGRAINAGESGWQGSIGGFNVSLNIQRVDYAPRSTNSIQMVSGPGQSDAGAWRTVPAWGAKTYIHEVGHILLGYRYGHDNLPGSIMNDENLNGTSVLSQHIKAAIKYPGNIVSGDCGCGS